MTRRSVNDGYFQNLKEQHMNFDEVFERIIKVYETISKWKLSFDDWNGFTSPC